MSSRNYPSDYKKGLQPSKVHQTSNMARVVVPGRVSSTNTWVHLILLFPLPPTSFPWTQKSLMVSVRSTATRGLLQYWWMQEGWQPEGRPTTHIHFAIALWFMKQPVPVPLPVCRDGTRLWSLLPLYYNYMSNNVIKPIPDSGGLCIDFLFLFLSEKKK